MNDSDLFKRMNLTKFNKSELFVLNYKLYLLIKIMNGSEFKMMFYEARELEYFHFPGIYWGANTSHLDRR